MTLYITPQRSSLVYVALPHMLPADMLIAAQ